MASQVQLPTRHNGTSVERLAGRLAALAEPSRLRIILALARGPASVTQLSERLEMAQPSVSHHIKILHNGGVVIRRRNGKSVDYSLTNGKVEGSSLTLELDSE